MIREEKTTRELNLAEMYAHRGYHDKTNIPENSMAAFRRAVEHGMPSELDVHLIADGSLVIFHDEELERMTGVKGRIEDYDIESLRRLHLYETDEKIPTLDEVLDLYEDTGLELLIELKVARGNYKALVQKTCERLASYKGRFAIESFDPRALIELRKIRPDIIRGQLSQNFFRDPCGLPKYQIILLTNLALNFMAKPDFIAYNFADRDNRALRRAVDKQGIQEATWTIRTPIAYKAAVKAGCIPIFENFNPKEVEV
ncbi:MAG TPA: glycerophosphodiester phosphodiesterase [Mogibacterium sp.]|nr:glycerophosphodiester phosphodiesterase [Mogibacterium sp.]